MKDHEPLLERGQRERIRVEETKIRQLVRGFAGDWKKSMEALNQDIMQSFSNFKIGTHILQVRHTHSAIREDDTTFIFHTVVS